MQETVARDQSVHSAARPPQARWGVFLRKERWGLSWRGRLLVVSGALVASYLLILNVYPFLAVTHRINADFLVVEGWINEYTIRAGAKEFKMAPYRRVFTTGGPENGSGGYVNDYQTSASVGADLLKKAGIPAEFLQMVPSHVIGRDRTYSSAMALRNWFSGQNVSVHGINVVTEDVHARRTRLLFQEALGPKVTVGVIAVPNPDYDPKHWWRYSEGVKDVFAEGVAYIYAKFFFYPSAASQNTKDKS
jgi:uncharacterized SAM-binding protein YcdF (DUF218 family)